MRIRPLTLTLSPAGGEGILLIFAAHAIHGFDHRVHAQGAEGVPGTDPGAPQLPRLVLKLVWTTAIATTIFGVGASLYIYKIVTFDDLAALMRVPH